MSMTAYQRKRTFKKTPEPKGRRIRRVPAKARQREFVVQKHDATRLHYDFRLEMEGVLKSWAVPKGPSLNPNDRRLAMMVEDHPFDYRNFEGIIPAGNYGAGTVIVWDRGTYHALGTEDPKESEKLLLAGLKKGHISFMLRGEKLRGEFALIKMRGAKEDNAWLLVKKNDEHAQIDDVTKNNESVISGQTLTDIDVSRGQRPSLGAAKTEVSPAELSPMLTTLIERPFDREGWIFEPKWDGYRAIAHMKDMHVDLISRTGKTFDAYPDINDAVAQLLHDAVLDGEIIALDTHGKPSFQTLQNYTKTKRGALKYVVFDLLFLDGHDTRSLPLKHRKELLATLLRNASSAVSMSPHRENEGRKAFAEAKKMGFEGVIAKDLSSQYLSGIRSRHWLKIKTHLRQEVVIGGFTAPRKSRKNFGALVVGVYDGDDLISVGHAGGGFTDASLKDMQARLTPLIRTTCPFGKKPVTNEPATWVDPKLVAEVSFQQWTEDGRMRQPIFEGLRPDKDPKDVHREVPMSIPSASKNKARPLPRRRVDAASSRRGERLQLKNLDKVFFPEDRITKGDVIEYYRSIADLLLPYLKDRPENLLRHPNGIEGKSFFHKDMDIAPGWVQTYPVQSESAGKQVDYIVCNDLDTLLYMVNLGCIEINPWNSRMQSIENPDYMIMDLDPEKISFDAVIEAAQATHDVLQKAGIESVPKTSGKTGMHIFVPLGAQYSYEQCKNFAHVIGGLVNQLLPKTTSLKRSPKDRQGKVYVDYLQNRRGQTLSVAYSVRPVKGATVSMPLEWREVKEGLNPRDFTIKNALKRIERKGDLWKPVLGKGIDMERALQLLM